ncbi:MAG: hypothetical protein A2W31_09880 [Planctomycetes bacterium RBG_16_64_10]|nr:MAG: hypothetical protein A2W31_09880 [Planctomycetes bacterium RBG_16_64_10]
MVRGLFIACALLPLCRAGGRDLAHGQSENLPGEIGVEVLTRGLLHEGYAQPVSFEPQPGEIVPVEPPEPIDELQPDYKLRGKHVGWMPGYWSWDTRLERFIWQSGFWRAWPPGRDYVPGYWEKVEGGWRWVSGFWIRRGAGELRYYPQPPRSQEAGPTSPAPSAGHFWVSGRYVWQENGFSWRDGFWTDAQRGWIWVPAHHVWTPAGAVAVEGYWDFALDQRAVLFASVSIPADLLGYPHFYFRPRVVLDPHILLEHLFCPIRGDHYLFGDYYGSDHHAAGILPWFAYHLTQGYDPLYAYYSWLHGTGWEDDQMGAYAYRDQHLEARPPETFREQQSRVDAESDRTSDESSLGRLLRDAAADRDSLLEPSPAGRGQGVDPAREGMPVPVMGRHDRARQEAELAAERAKQGNANKVLSLKLPLNKLAGAVRRMPPSVGNPPQAGTLPQTGSRPLAPPETRARLRDFGTMPGYAVPGRRSQRFRRFPPETLPPVPLPRSGKSDLLPGFSGGSRGPSVLPRRPGVLPEVPKLPDRTIKPLLKPSRPALGG